MTPLYNDHDVSLLFINLLEMTIEYTDPNLYSMWRTTLIDHRRMRRAIMNLTHINKYWIKI